MTDTIKPEVAEAAAEWWANQISGDVRHDNGDAMQSALATTLRKRSHGDDGLDPELVEQFKHNLEETLKETSYRGKNHTLGVDYHPCPMLTEAADNAGIDTGMTTFPFKTTMWIEEERILASAGYRGDREEIYTTDNWPPVVLDITAEMVGFTIDLPPYSVEDEDYTDVIERRLARESYEGYDLEVRELRDLSVHDSEIVEGPNHSTSDYHRVTVTGEASIFVAEDYIERVRDRHLFGVYKRVTSYLKQSDEEAGEIEVTDDLLEELVGDALEKYDLLNVDVTNIGGVSGEFTEAW